MVAGVLSLLLLCLISTLPGSAKVVLEDGYDVSTVLDGNKLRNSQGIHPYSILPGKKQHVFFLDSVNSAFYTIPLPISQDGEINVFAGKGVAAAGYSDGDATTATFSHPKSFAVDSTGNVYVADRTNHVVRKISPSGKTTTIAGGYTGKTGKIDGPAQNASFSSDFDLVFIPGMCTLLISDRGNSLVRQLNLKREDCTHESQPGIGASSVSIIAILSALAAFLAGFLARPFIVSHETHGFSKTWNPCPTKLETIPPTVYSGIKSGAASVTVAITAVYMFLYKLVGTIFYHLLLRVHNESRQELQHVVCTNNKPVVSLVDCVASGNLADSAVSFPGGLDAPDSNHPASKLDGLISSNLSDFVSGNPNPNSNTTLFRRKF